MRVMSVVLFILLFFPLAYAQQTWMRTYGGTGWDYGYAVQQTSDGGYIIAGRTSSFGAGVEDVYLIKINIFGDTLWTRTYGGASSDIGYAVQQTTDGGYIISGQTGVSYKVYLIKTNASGDALWTRTYDSYACGQSVQQTSDGGYIIAGHTYSHGAGWDDVLLIKINPSGDTLWTKTYGGTSYDCGYSVQQTTDGGYIVAGRTWSFGTTGDDFDVYLIKTNALGDTLWTNTYGDSSWDEGYSVRQTTDGGYVITGYTYVGDPIRQDVFLIKTNATGDTIWTKTIGGFGGTGGNVGYCVQQTSDAGYIIAGWTWAGEYDIYLIKTNALGDTLWTKTFGGSARDQGYSVRQTSDGGYIITGLTESFGAGNYDVYLIKTDGDGNIAVEEESGPESMVKRTKYILIPNPFRSFASVLGYEKEWFTLYDITGRQVGIYRGDRIGKGLSPGVYFLRVEKKNTMPVRVVKIH